MLRADHVTSIGIYGMGGVGKTTLIKHINNKLVEMTHECVFWVTVSQEYSVRILQDKIARVIGVNLSHEDDENKRAARLYRALSSLRKNFVLILDDVWKNINLEKVGIPLCVEGSKLIITTRSLQVCRQIGCQKLIQVKTLEPNEAWVLFSDTLGQEVTLSPQVEEIAKGMAKLCDGLPLGIIILAGSMRGETAVHVWKNALIELRESVMEHDDMEEHVFKVLKYSFDRLNPKHQEQGESGGGHTDIQHCFLYCSLYREDDEIKREDLARKLIIEELVDKRKSWEAQAGKVHTILDKLVNVCLLESVDNHYVKMHDLVRAMALRITRGKYMVLAGCLLEKIPNEDEYWTEDVEKMSLMYNRIKEIPDGMSLNCPKLSTLFLQWNQHLKFIADSFFSQMHGLCMLDLSYCVEIPKLPNSVSDLESLKALILGNCRKLIDVPYLGKLKALKELNLSRTAIREVPKGMDELANLQILSMDGASHLKILPADLLPKLRNLQYLRLPYEIEAPIIEIESLTKLEEFRGRVSDVADFNRLIGCRPLLKYYIRVWPRQPNSYSEVCVCNGISVAGHNYLMEDAAMLAHDTQHLGLSKCEGLSKSLLDDFPKFNNPKSLQTLIVDDCEEIECILAKNGELESHSVAPLGTLENIQLKRLRDFMGINAKQEVVLPTPARAVFSSLRELDFFRCNKMKNLGLIGSEFPKLESIKVHQCSEIEEIIEQGGVVSFPKLEQLWLQCLPKLKNVGLTRSEFPNLELICVENCEEIEEIIEQVGVSFPKLNELKMSNLPKLRNVGAMICNSVEKIEISKCGALKKVPLYFPVVSVSDGGESSNVSYSPPFALKTVYLRRGEEEWWESLEWDHPLHKHLLKPFVRFG